MHVVQLNAAPSDTEGLDAITRRRGLTFLKQDLAQNVGSSGRPVVLIHHYGFDEFSTGEEDPTRPWWTASERQRYWDAIKGYNVAAILTGHDHRNAGSSWTGGFCNPAVTVNKSGRCANPADGIPWLVVSALRNGTYVRMTISSTGTLTAQRMGVHVAENTTVVAQRYRHVVG